jgi:hypothetical protein
VARVARKFLTVRPSLGALGLGIALCGCASASAPRDGDRRPAIGRRVAAGTLPPTENGVDAPVLGPVRDASGSRAAFDGENFLVVWQDDRGA